MLVMWVSLDQFHFLTHRLADRLPQSDSHPGEKELNLFSTHKWRENIGGRNSCLQRVIVARKGCLVYPPLCVHCAGKGALYDLLLFISSVYL